MKLQRTSGRESIEPGKGSMFCSSSSSSSSSLISLPSRQIAATSWLNEGNGSFGRRDVSFSHWRIQRPSWKHQRACRRLVRCNAVEKTRLRSWHWPPFSSFLFLFHSLELTRRDSSLSWKTMWRNVVVTVPRSGAEQTEAAAQSSDELFGRVTTPKTTTFLLERVVALMSCCFLGEKEGGRFAIGSLCSRIPQTSTSRQGDTRTFEEVSGGKLCSLRPWKNDDGNSRHLQRIRHCRLCKQGVTFRTFMMHFPFFSKQGALDNNNKPLCLEIDLVNYSLFFLRRCIRFGDMKNAEFFNQWTLSSGHIRFIPVSLIRNTIGREIKNSSAEFLGVDVNGIPVKFDGNL